MRNLLDKTLDSVLGNRFSRWMGLVAAVALAAMLILLPTSTAKERASNQTLGFVMLAIAVLLLFGAIYMEIRDWPLTQLERAYRIGARRAIQSGRALRLPRLTPLEAYATLQSLPQVRRFAFELMSVPWGENAMVNGAELRPLFDETIAFVRRVSGDWRKYAEPIEVFAGMPSPWCFIGAAEVMHRLSYTRGDRYVPYGLRQGLRFIALAQAADSENADALVTRARLLASTSERTWLRLAEDTLRRVQAIAPQHPRLPGAEARLFARFGEYDKALLANEQSIARATTPADEVNAQIARANLLRVTRRYDEAIRAYQSLLQSETDDPWLWHNLSLVLFIEKRNREALEANQRALALMPFAAAAEFTPVLRKAVETKGEVG